MQCGAREPKVSRVPFARKLDPRNISIHTAIQRTQIKTGIRIPACDGLFRHTQSIESAKKIGLYDDAHVINIASAVDLHDIDVPAALPQ
jgi:hypothetical protein